MVHDRYFVASDRGRIAVGEAVAIAGSNRDTLKLHFKHLIAMKVCLGDPIDMMPITLIPRLILGLGQRNCWIGAIA
ncbi:hypothetical protein [Altericista sp. CCNU0014]|uniref:hypothetical protein n=1 Tax=Altericista sp. CCNU0014 TaxID=3082949 RepID=UPI003850ACF3